MNDEPLLFPTSGPYPYTTITSWKKTGTVNADFVRSALYLD